MTYCKTCQDCMSRKARDELVSLEVTAAQNCEFAAQEIRRGDRSAAKYEIPRAIEALQALLKAWGVE